MAVVSKMSRSEEETKRRNDLKMNEAVMKAMRETDTFESNNYPQNAMNHAARSSLKLNPSRTDGEFVDAKVQSCIICHKKIGSGKYKKLIRCQGNMNGFKQRNREVSDAKESDPKCRNQFHKKCLTDYNAGNLNLQYSVRKECQGKLLCSLHCCEKCNIDGYRQSAYQGKLIECAICFRAFHFESCLPAGCQLLTVKIDYRNFQMMICDSHQKKENFTVENHINACCNPDCKKGNRKLTRCKVCVRSFHPECRKVETIEGVATEDEKCDHCILKQSVGLDAPVLALDLAKKVFRLGITRGTSGRDVREEVGNVVVEWIGSDTSDPPISVLPVSCVAPFMVQYFAAAKPFSEEFCSEILKNYTEQFAKSRPYICKYVYETGGESKHISENLPKRWTIGIGSEDTCSVCKGFAVECPETCPQALNCENRKVTTGECSEKIELRATNDRGFGVFATRDIEAGEYIAPYVGEIIDVEEQNRRLEIIRLSGDRQANFYMMQYGKNSKDGCIIDGAAFGNIARYVNHSCSPNCITQKTGIIMESDEDDHHYETRVYFEACKHISKGEEVTISYDMDHFDLLSNCKCGAENCDGKMTKKTSGKVAKAEEDMTQQRKRKQGQTLQKRSTFKKSKKEPTTSK